MGQRLQEFWPTDAALRECIKGDAEAANEAVLLAVHQRIRMQRSDFGASGAPTPCTEREVLAALLAPSADGRVIVPIVGTSGVGKSHVIRWLNAHLQHDPDAKRRVVIRIPKGSSLRGVLELLLGHDALAGESFEHHRKSLRRAHESLGAEDTAHMLCEMLAQVLESASKEAQRRRATSSTLSELEKFQEALGDGRILPALLRNQYLRGHHWIQKPPNGNSGPVSQLVEQLSQARSADEEDDRKRLFEAADLSFSESMDRNQLGLDVQRAVALMARESTRAGAARVLNAALDTAKGRLLMLEQTVGGIFEDVRRELHVQKKELVLLVEDFAMMAGLQGQILQAIIQEAVRDGRQIMCTLRTALAYTPGYFDPPDTFRTRAVSEWIIPDSPGDEEELLGRVERLVGAYLNAARIGVKGLEEGLAAAGGARQSIEDGDWVSRAEQPGGADGRILKDFGLSEEGNPLFPFNRDAIRVLAREKSTRNRTLVYNPRMILQNVLKKVLQQREAFLQGTFPPPGFRAQETLPSPKIRAWLDSQPLQDSERNITLLAYWYASATTSAELAGRPTAIFEAFGLKAPWKETKSGQMTKPEPVTKTGTGTAPLGPVTLPPTSPSVPPTSPKPAGPEAEWADTLERWQRGEMLVQARLRKLRPLLASAIFGAIDWSWSLVRFRRKLETIWAESIWLPCSFGVDMRPPERSMCVVCTDAERADPIKGTRIARGLLALVRRDLHGGWTYDGADEDLPHCMALVDPLVARTRAYLLQRPFEGETDPTPTLVSGLLVGARALGLEGARAQDLEKLIEALFVPASKVPALSPAAGEWAEAERALIAIRSDAKPDPKVDARISSWRTLLLDWVGARQGNGETVVAVDVARLKPLVETTTKDWSIVKPPSPIGEAADGLSIHLKGLTRLPVALKEESDRVGAWRQRMQEAFTPGLNGESKTATLAELRKAIESAEAAGEFTVSQGDKSRELLQRFQGEKAVEAFQAASELAAASDQGTRLRSLGRQYEPARTVSDELVKTMQEFFSSLESKLEAFQARVGEHPERDAVELLRTELDEMNAQLGRETP
ncbi:protein DpdH [Corallococcus sp. bb12-1]|uniref:protein DpdH n=1 Tax=Corallococcus sp. bb12-1 TaxID=2996784 RepID=UPI00226FC985|nr:protein DpdH [Corallococcus sp. bb12-1]MCY1045629.1 protein DpdH [Corallococcus sp. bb12-1]